MKLFEKLSPFLIKISFTSFFYVTICHESVEYKNPDYYLNLLVFYSFYLGTGLFGYFINDISDENTDKKAGKINVTTNLSARWKFTLILILFLIGCFPIIFFSPNTSVLVILEYILLLIYSFPPFRLKERGFVGIITDSLYAYFIPSLILLTFLSSFTEVQFLFWIFLPLFGLVLGISNILNHQLEDFDNDIITQTKTFSTTNRRLAERLKIVSILGSIIIFLIATISVVNENFNLTTKVFFIVTSLVLFTKGSFYVIFKNEKYLSGLPEFSVIYYGVLVTTISMLISKEFENLFLMLFLLIPSISIKIKSTLITLWFILIRFYIFNRRIISFIVNYSLYYSFLLVGIDLKKRNELKSLSQSKKEIVVNSIKINEKNVHGLWIGTELSPMELLTINSFITNGYHFHLWVYETLKTSLPEDCILCDANIIIPEESVFKYKYSSQFGTGKGSYAGFSDIFRYKLLHDVGGWWVDMDVTCLKPFDVDSPYFFRSHHNLPLVGNIMKAPKGSLLMKRCYEEATIEITENNRDWHKPISILVKNVIDLNLEKYIVKDVNNSDEWHLIKQFVEDFKTFPEDWYFLHWCNEVWRTNGFSKVDPMYFSTYGMLLSNYSLIPKLSLNDMKRHDKNLKFKLFMEKVNDFL